MSVELVLGLASLLVTISLAVFTTWSSRRQSAQNAELKMRTDAELASLTARLQREAKAEDRENAARIALDRYREPLLMAADDLRSRIHNIREKGFLGYLQEDQRLRDMAIHSTLFRFATYFGWVETLSREVRFLHLESTNKTKQVIEVMARIGRTFAGDHHDRLAGGPRLMLWREEQRALGGLMQREGGGGTIGFEDFEVRYCNEFSRWLHPFAEDLDSPGIAQSTRLTVAQKHLTELINLLDHKGLLTRRSPTMRASDADQQRDCDQPGSTT